MPIGGQGVNAGIHDAVGLARRLATVLAGQAQQVVPESYDQERRGAHARLDRRQATGFRRAVGRGRATDLALDLAARLPPGIGSLRTGGDLGSQLDGQALALAVVERLRVAPLLQGGEESIGRGHRAVSEDPVPCATTVRPAATSTGTPRCPRRARAGRRTNSRP